MNNKLQISKELIIGILQSGYKPSHTCISDEFTNIYESLCNSQEDEKTLPLLHELDLILHRELDHELVHVILDIFDNVES